MCHVLGDYWPVLLECSALVSEGRVGVFILVVICGCAVCMYGGGEKHGERFPCSGAVIHCLCA